MNAGRKLVSVVMATYNGAPFLRQQLDSILGQTYGNLEVIVSDDGSSDGTVDILDEYAAKSTLRWYVNETKRGPRSNFANALTDVLGEYVAFSDQDDVWKPTKIEDCVGALQAVERVHGEDTPILVYTDLELVDADLTPIAPSFYKFLGRNPRLNTLNRMLSGSIVAGCSTLCNLALVRAAMPIPDEAIMHDTWFALVACTLGRLEFLNMPTSLYRQHGGNAVGVEKGALFDKVLHMLTLRFDNRQYRDAFTTPRYAQARALLQRHEPSLSEQTTRLFRAFLECEHQSFLTKRVNILLHGFFRHSKLENLELLLRI